MTQATTEEHQRMPMQLQQTKRFVVEHKSESDPKVQLVQAVLTAEYLRSDRVKTTKKGSNKISVKDIRNIAYESIPLHFNQEELNEWLAGYGLYRVEKASVQINDIQAYHVTQLSGGDSAADPGKELKNRVDEISVGYFSPGDRQVLISNQIFNS